MRKDRSYALAVVLGITWMCNMGLLIGYLINTFSTYAIIALLGTFFTGLVPSVAQNLNEYSKKEGFPIAIGSLLHIAVGLVGAIFVGLTVGESDYNEWTLAAAASNIISNGVAHQLFLDDDRQVKIIEDDDMLHIAKILVSVPLGLIFAFVGMLNENTVVWSATVHTIAFLVYALLLIAAQDQKIFITRFYLGSAMLVISSCALEIIRDVYTMGIFTCVMLLLVMGHWAPTLDDRSETYRNDRIN